MNKVLNFLLLPLILLVSCEERYQPDIEKVDEQLVVEAQITNDPSRNFVHLSRTRSYNDNVPLTEVLGATVELIENQSNKIRSTESSAGYYLFNSVPVSGKNYFLRIKIVNDTYESEEVTMPPIPTITNFHTEHVVKKVYVANGEGVPIPFDRQGREIYVDMPVTNSLSHYRFDVRSVLEWIWDSIPTPFSANPTAYGWNSYKQNEKFNIAGPANFSQTDKIEKHPLLMISYDPLDYLYSDTLVSRGWILIIEQLGTSKGSYEYHEKLNNQFAANGSLFDPIQNQVYGNILCKSNPSKVVFGYFDLNSYHQYRYYFNLSIPPGVITMRQIFRYPEIPHSNGIMRTQPIKGPPDEIPPPLPPPVWWE